MRWGLVGASDIAARALIPAIRAQPKGEVVAVYSRSAGRGAAYAREHGIPRAVTSLDELLAEDVEAVYVSTTNDRHRDETVAAARAGKHVLCEKPLALTVDDAAAMVDACQQAGVVLATNHGRRNEGITREARRLVAAGALGRVLAARTSSAVLLPERLRTWRLADPATGPGVVLDIVVHDADTLRFVLQDEPVEAAALTTQQGFAAGDVEDAVMGVLRLGLGALASFHCAFTVPHADAGFEVHGAAGTLIARRRRGEEPPTLLLRHDGGEERIGVGPEEDVHVATVRAFEAAVRGECPPVASGEDGLRSLAVALATLESARTGRTVAVPRPFLSEGPGILAG